MMTGVLVALAATGSWIISDRLERDNEFCTSCHLQDGTPLHEQLRADFERVVPISLAGVHGRGWVEDREDFAFRCIDCHAGSGALERAKVKARAGWDGLRYVAGSFEEPEGMPFELSKSACRRCHPGFRHSAAPGFTVEAYHGLPAHDQEEGPACVTCHVVHERGRSGIVYFMALEPVGRICEDCHEEEGAPSLGKAR
ncbi:MAG: cytochrome c3 family protein [Deltaproteobacteria bacterium]|nr:cytochrome c3 family protein [Deltaproteobacteria bacterium]MBW2396049.1 cytochrome c3 family protein [Deltaproteobacteria bacterium]